MNRDTPPKTKGQPNDWSATGQITQRSRVATKASWGRYSLLFKLNLTIGALFLLTMAFFVTVSYRADRRFQIEHTVLLLRSTLRMAVSTVPPDVTPPLAYLEAQLNGMGMHHYSLALMDDDDRVVLSEPAGAKAGDISESIAAASNELKTSEFAVTSRGDMTWIVVAERLPDGKRLLLLLDWGHIASGLRVFWTIHGTHVAVTLALFLLVVWIITERFVRRPLRALFGAFRRLELGNWVADPAVQSKDEFGLLAEKIKSMTVALKEHVDRFVRVEKYAAAAMVVIRIGRELKGPLAVIRRHVGELSTTVGPSPALAVLAAELDMNMKEIDRSLARLSEIQHPGEWGI